MATDIIVPHLGESVEIATLAAWLKKPGDAISRGETIADIETDKATMPLESPSSGVLLAVYAAEGEAVRIGQLLAQVGQPGEVPQTASPAEEFHAPEPIVTPQAGPEPGSRRVRITPLARRKANDLGVNLAELTPGRSGKIAGEDVERFAAQRAAADEAEAPAPSVAARRVPLSNLRRIVGKRMTASAQNVPQFSVSIDADAARLLEFRAALKETGRDVSLTALLVRLTATALQAHPMVNAQFDGDEVLVFETVNVAVAVAAPDGLRVPVIHGAEKLSLMETASRLDELARLARSGQLASRLTEGSTFTLSNLGMFGVAQFTPLINPPQAAILGVGAARPVLAPGPDGRALPAKMMTLTLTADHRVLDGADAAAFLATLKDEVERCLILRVE